MEQVGPGLFRHPDAVVTEKHTYAEAAKVVPGGVVCLLSALAFREIGTQMPHEVWLALRAHSKRPTASAVSLRIVWFSSDAFTEGVETHTVEGVKVRVYSSATTIADPFKFRSKVGVDVAVEAPATRGRGGSSPWRRSFGSRRSVGWRVMRPYLEAIVS